MRISKIIILVAILVILLSSTALAVTEIVITKDNISTFEVLYTSIEKEIEGNKATTLDSISITVQGKSTDKVELFEFDKTSGILKFNDEKYKEANKKQADKAIIAFIKGIKDSSLTLDTQQDIVNQIQESNTDVAAVMIPLIFGDSKADLFTAYKWLFPFIQMLRIVFGIGSIIIILLLIGSTIIDMVYIGLPVWRVQQEEKGQGKHPFGVSYEALKTVKEVEKNLGEGSYQNAYIIYFKRRALTYIILSICLLYLIVGELGGLISWILGLASGIVV